MRIIVLGAGGHAQVIADAVARACEAGTDWEVLGFLDDDPALTGQTRQGLPVFGPLSMLPAIEHEGCVIGIGNNQVRERIYRQLRIAGARLVSCIHPRSVIAPDVLIGEGTVVFAGVIINTGSAIGNNVILNTGCTVDHHNVIGDHVHIAPGAHLGGDVVIGEGSLVGLGATVMPQRRVGIQSIVGAGALVLEDVADDKTVVGVPAKAILSHCRM